MILIDVRIYYFLMNPHLHIAYNTYLTIRLDKLGWVEQTAQGAGDLETIIKFFCSSFQIFSPGLGIDLP